MTVQHTASTRTPSLWLWRWPRSTTPSWPCPEPEGFPATSRRSPWRTNEPHGSRGGETNRVERGKGRRSRKGGRRGGVKQTKVMLRRKPSESDPQPASRSLSSSSPPARKPMLTAVTPTHPHPLHLLPPCVIYDSAGENVSTSSYLYLVPRKEERGKPRPVSPQNSDPWLGWPLPVAPLSSHLTGYLFSFSSSLPPPWL